ncbi:MAG TPA: BamA/TamA family outer membrane protein [bacterium]|jgi:outer membrane protein insertion porin family
MRYVLFIALLLLGMALNATAAGKFVFHGNRKFSGGELQQLLDVSDPTSAGADTIASRVNGLADSLIARDFLFARVDSSHWVDGRRGRRELHVYLHEGPLARISSLRWMGDSLKVSPSVRGKILCTPGSVFHWSDLQFDTDLLLTFFENSGYPFAKVDVAKLETDSAETSVDVWLSVTAGPLTQIEFVSFPGNRQTRDAFLRRETRLRRSEPYDQRKVESARRRLVRLDFVKRAGPGEIAVNEAGQTGVRFPIEEARSTRLDAVAGYLPQSKGQKGLLTGLVNVEFLNLFGGGRRARVHWEQPDRRVQAVDVAYREPWIFNQPLALRLDFGQRIQDTLYVTRKLGAQLELELPGNLSVWGAIHQESVFADSLSSALYGLPNSNTTFLESGVSFDTRDHPTNPRGGVFFSTQAGTGWRHRERVASSNEPAGSFQQTRGGIDAEVAREVFPFWIADVSLHAKALGTTEPEVLLPDLYRLGGARTLRGYREEQFLGSRVGWTSAELRYWLGPASRVFLFCDVGSAYRQQHVNSVAQTTTLVRAGSGIGLRLETDLGVWGFDYGIGQGDKLLSGKLHISLLSSF